MQLAFCWSCVILSNRDATCLLLELCYNRDRGAISPCSGGRTDKVDQERDELNNWVLVRDVPDKSDVVKHLKLLK